MLERIDSPRGAAINRSTPAAPRLRRTLTVTVIGATTAVLLALYALSGATVAPDGQLIESFGALAIATIALTGLGLLGLVRMFGSVRRNSTCGRGGC